MARELILHIGVTKTGSTSIQHSVAQLRDQLAARQVFYPMPLGRIDHHPLAAVFAGAAGASGSGLSTRLGSFRDSFKAELDSMPSGTTRCIITSEHFSVLPRRRQVQALADFLMPYFDSARVIVYLRRQDEHVASAYNQYLRNGVAVEPALFREGADGNQRRRYLNYKALLHRFAAAFGARSIRPRIFARDALAAAGGDVVTDFLQAAGIDVPAPETPGLRERNLSINLEGQAILLAALKRRAAQPDADSEPDAQWRILCDWVTQVLPGRGWRPTRDEARNFIEHFAETNEAVRRAYFPQRATLFSTDFSNFPETETRPTPETLFENALTLVLHATAAHVSREFWHQMTLFRAHKRAGDRDGMRSALERAIRLDPNKIEAKLQLAKLFFEDGKFSMARDHAQAALLIRPGLRAAAKIKQAAERSLAARL